MKFHQFIILGFCCALTPALAKVSLPAIISDHMVVQRDRPVRIWGSADRNEKINVTFRNQTISTTADANGHWELFLRPMLSAPPSELIVAGENTITIQDVLVGDVWVASGQSNMVWPIERSDNATREIETAPFSSVRLFQVKPTISERPLVNVEGTWKGCSPESDRQFSAVGYFFGRHLYQKLNVPIGLIQSAVGGSPAEAWTSHEALQSSLDLRVYLTRWAGTLAEFPAAQLKYEADVKQWEADGKPRQRRPRPPVGPGHFTSPSGLFNGMISPLLPLSITGVIWYQGEANANRGERDTYETLFKTMITDWRRRWGQGDFPFLFAQLANFDDVPATSAWPEIREAQAAALSLRNTGMVVTIDVGNPKDIHPTDKLTVGNRMALAALSVAYGQKAVYSGPVYRQMTTEPRQIRVWFDHAGSGLKCRDAGFFIAGADQAFVKAEVRIDGDSVILRSPAVPNPVAVRYAWGNSPQAGLTNAEGLPAVPFRTDRWAR